METYIIEHVSDGGHTTDIYEEHSLSSALGVLSELAHVMGLGENISIRVIYTSTQEAA